MLYTIRVSYGARSESRMVVVLKRTAVFTIQPAFPFSRWTEGAAIRRRANSLQPREICEYRGVYLYE